jgi:tRNA A37 methylthiotransferase MiaB
VEVKTQLVGRTRGDLVVCFDGDASLKGQILQVKITRAQNLTLFGQICDDSSPLLS